VVKRKNLIIIIIIIIIIITNHILSSFVSTLLCRTLYSISPLSHYHGVAYE